jgi:hypothetical protein
LINKKAHFQLDYYLYKQSCATGTMYKNNSGLIARLGASEYKKGLYLNEKLAVKISLLLLY